MDEHDPLKEILGNELYEELESLDIDYQATSMLGMVTPETLDTIMATGYEGNISFTGQDAIELVSSLYHAAQAGCQDCHSRILRFAGAIIGQMWIDILHAENIDMDGLDDD